MTYLIPNNLNIMKYLFFHLYNRLYQDGKNDKNKHPEYDTLGLISFGTFMWLLTFYCVYYYYVLNMSLPESFQGVSISAGLIISILFYFTLIYGKQHEKIYLKYKGLNNKQRKLGLLISILYVFLPFLISVYITLDWHGKI